MFIHTRGVSFTSFDNRLYWEGLCPIFFAFLFDHIFARS